MEFIHISLNVPNALMRRIESLGSAEPTTLIERLLLDVNDGQVNAATATYSQLPDFPEYRRLPVAVPNRLIDHIVALGATDGPAVLVAILLNIPDELIALAHQELCEAAFARDTETPTTPARPDTVNRWEIWDALRSYSPQKRREAARILIRIGKPAVPRLLDIVHGSHNAARLAAVRVLGAIADPATVPVLRGLLFSDYNGRVREAALEALERIATPEAAAAVAAARRKKRLSALQEYLRLRHA